MGNVQILCEEHSKTLLKDVKKAWINEVIYHASGWKTQQYKDVNSPQMKPINPMHSQSESSRDFYRTRQADSKLIWKSKQARRAKSVLEKQNDEMTFDLPASEGTIKHSN